MNSTIRLHPMLAALAVSAFCLTASVSRAETVAVDGVQWTYEVDGEGKATVTGGPKKGILEIPGNLGGHPVAAIGERAFGWCAGLTEVVFPEGLERIGPQAFSGCHGLTSVALPDSVEHLDGRAFCYCTNLQVVFPGTGLTDIGDEAFEDCYALTACPLPDGVKSIGKCAFAFCGGLTEMDLPGGLENIGILPFYGCNELAGFSMDGSNGAFAVSDGVLFSGDMKTLVCVPCGKAGSWTVPDGTEAVGTYAFGGSTLETLVLPESLEELGDFAFYRSAGLAALALPDGLVRVGERAFYGCRGLKEVGIGAGTTDVTGQTFELCTGVQRFQVAEANPALTAQDGILFSKDRKTLVCFPAGRNGTAEIPAGVEVVGESAFFGCDHLESVSMPDGLREIGDHAFNYCPELKGVVLPDGVERIGSWAFYYSTGLETVEIPDSVTEIGDHAFAACYALASVRIPPRVTEITPDAFDWCSGLPSIEIPSGVTNIGTEAFANCNAMTTLAIPDSVAAIGSGAFCNSEGLVTVKIGNGVKHIGASAFFGCGALAWLVLPESVESVGRYAFCNCGNLETLWVPASWEGTSMLDGTELPRDCQVVYGMPDPMEARYGWWLAEYGKTPREMPENGDEDGDGAKNGEEFVAGTDPLDPGERFEVRIREVDGKWMAEGLPERTGRTYRVLGTTELPPVGEAVWEDVGGVDDLTKTDWRFFRVGVSLPQ
jgi:hypothetical protein